MSDSTVRVRFAPSPTGQLHIGSARTALYNWALARRHSGSFVLRIDDTDPERSTKENTHAILEAMRWLGLDWDEGPEVGGEYGPYFQTQRMGAYTEAIEELLSREALYPCFCTVEELDERRNAARSVGGFAGYDRRCRGLDRASALERRASGEAHVLRLAVPEGRGDVTFQDAVRGEVVTSADALDDLVVVRTDGSPTYNFATVVDDATMEISHVIRGEDHISNTPRQILIFEALGLDVPVFAHMSLTFGPDGKRLSKRHGATSVEAFREMGIVPDALVNYIALLGWSLDDKTTLIDRETLTSSFSLERLSSNPGIFDLEKVEWMNGVYIREMTVEEFRENVISVLADAGLVAADDLAARPEWFTKLAGVLQERTKRLDEIVPKVTFLFVDHVEMDDKARAKALEKEGAGRVLDAAHAALSALSQFDTEAIEESLREIPEALALKPRVVFQAVRVAISGSMVSPPLFESLELLGRDAVLARIEAARSLAAE